MKPEQWIVTGEVGTSSKTIWAVMMGAVDTSDRLSFWHYDAPHDPDDFSRCYKLLALFPEWRRRLPEVVTIFPKWVGFVREWDTLVAMHESLQLAPAANYRKMYEFMRKLEDEGMVADGWICNGQHSWYRGKPSFSATHSSCP